LKYQIDYVLSAPSDISIRIINITGQEVRTLEFKDQAAGQHSITWDGRSGHRKEAGAGIYFYSLTVNGKLIATKRMAKTEKN